MKKTISFFILVILTTSISFSQTFETNFLGDDFMRYKGALLKLIDNPISGLNFTFYSNLNYCQDAYNDHVIYPDLKYHFKTVPDSLANRIFKVEDIVGKDGKTFSGGSYSFEKPIFVLKDTVTKQVIYYIFDKKYDFNFPFLTSKIAVDKDALCNDISRSVDEFTGEIKISSPLSEGSKLAPVIIYKDINKTSTAYYLSLHTNGNTLNVGESGVIILLDDGTKINKSDKIDVEAADNGWDYRAFISLTQSDLQLLSTKKINKYRLYIYDETLSKWFAEKFINYVKCIREKK